MASLTTKGLAVGATLLGGLLAGVAVNKALIQMPAWGEVGQSAWVNFTLTADQGLGLILFPAIGGGALIAAVGAAASFYFDRKAPRSATVPIYAAPILAVAALFVTLALLAPPRLGLAEVGDDGPRLQQTFAIIARWWDLKAFLHLLTFGSSVWALAAVLPSQPALWAQRDATIKADGAITNRAMPATSHVLLAATLIGGLLAGFNLDRSLVHNPAWRQLGAAAWAAYSQHADLSVRGALLYPFLGIGEALLSVAAVVIARPSLGQLRAAALPLYAGALFAVVGLSMTILAAPNMLSVPRLVDDPPALQRALDGFVFWGDIRSAFQTLAFFANLWALVAVMSKVETGH